jgi:hypothetical protein
MDVSGDHQVKQNKTDSESQISHIFSYMWNVDQNLKKKNKEDIKIVGDY